MTSVGQLHQEAMLYAERATVAKIEGDSQAAGTLFLRACELESAAANLLRDSDVEPSRSVLYRSAASLAYECGKMRESERLIALALAGDPPVEIAEELRNLLERVSFHQRLAVKGFNLQATEVQLAISGRDAGWGIAPVDVVLERLQSFKSVVYRTVERVLARPYREGGPSSAASAYPLFLQAFTPGSFEVTLSIGQPLQLKLPEFEGFDPAADVVQEIFDCIELLNQAEEDRLRQRIPEAAYFNNFVALMKKIAPDGESVIQVGFHTRRAGRIRSIVLNRQQEAISQIKKVIEVTDMEVGRPIRLQGILRFADAVKERERGVIKLVDAQNIVHRIVVPQGMDDIVGPLWSQAVIVTGRQVRGKIILQDIERDPA